MFKLSLFATFAVGTLFVTAALMSSAPANASPSCRPGIIYQEDGGIQSHRKLKGDCVRHFDTGQYDYYKMIYTNRHPTYDYRPGFGIDPISSYHEGYGYGSRHRRHCRTPNIWRNHQPVWVMRCSPHYNH